MDGLASNGGSGTQQSREPAHPHHRSGGFAAPPYSTPAAAQSGCAAIGSASRLDSLHARSSYSASSSSQSPSGLAGAASVATTAPPPHNSDVHHQAAAANTYSTNYPTADYAAPPSSSSASYHETTKSSTADPPKKPLSPYMRFSKSIWFEVKAANPSLSVCQIGATIGRMWRELTEAEKQRHLEDFNQDKVRYDNELKRYLKATGLRAKDLRAMAKTQPKAKNRNRNRSSNLVPSSTVTNSNPQLAAQAAAFMGLPITSGMPMGMLGAAAGAMSMLSPHFTQVWHGGQQYAGQPMVGITAAGQLQLAAAAQYSNGYALCTDAGSAAHAVGAKSLATRDAQSTSPMYRYGQSYL